MVLAAVVGGFLGLLLVAIFDPQGHIQDGYLDLFSAFGGALVAVGIDRALRG
jgi:hypothetical protein